MKNGPIGVKWIQKVRLTCFLAGYFCFRDALLCILELCRWNHMESLCWDISWTLVQTVDSKRTSTSWHSKSNQDKAIDNTVLSIPHLLRYHVKHSFKSVALASPLAGLASATSSVRALASLAFQNQRLQQVMKQKNASESVRAFSSVLNSTEPALLSALLLDA